jgi:uncharacterized protein YkwD
MTSITYRQREAIELPAPVYVIWLLVKLLRFIYRFVMCRIARTAPVPTGHAATVMSPAAKHMASLLFDDANNYRAANGLATLQYEGRLVDSAYFHAFRMAQTGEFEHTLSDGVDLGTRVARAGFSYALVRENIAYTTDTLSGTESIARCLHQGWVDSPGHRENLLATDVTQLGVAVITWYGLTYAVQNFGAPQAAILWPTWSVQPPRAVLLTDPFGGAQ